MLGNNKNAGKKKGRFIDFDDAGIQLDLPKFSLPENLLATTPNRPDNIQSVAPTLTQQPDSPPSPSRSLLFSAPVINTPVSPSLPIKLLSIDVMSPLSQDQALTMATLISDYFEKYPLLYERNPYIQTYMHRVDTLDVDVIGWMEQLNRFYLWNIKKTRGKREQNYILDIQAVITQLGEMGIDQGIIAAENYAYYEKLLNLPSVAYYITDQIFHDYKDLVLAVFKQLKAHADVVKLQQEKINLENKPSEIQKYGGYELSQKLKQAIAIEEAVACQVTVAKIGVRRHLVKHAEYLESCVPDDAENIIEKLKESLTEDVVSAFNLQLKGKGVTTDWMKVKFDDSSFTYAELLKFFYKIQKKLFQRPYASTHDDYSGHALIEAFVGYIEKHKPNPFKSKNIKALVAWYQLAVRIHHAPETITEKDFTRAENNISGFVQLMVNYLQDAGLENVYNNQAFSVFIQWVKNKSKSQHSRFVVDGIIQKIGEYLDEAFLRSSNFLQREFAFLAKSGLYKIINAIGSEEDKNSLKDIMMYAVNRYCNKKIEIIAQNFQTGSRDLLDSTLFDLLHGNNMYEWENHEFPTQLEDGPLQSLMQAFIIRLDALASKESVSFSQIEAEIERINYFNTSFNALCADYERAEANLERLSEDDLTHKLAEIQLQKDKLQERSGIFYGLLDVDIEHNRIRPQILPSLERLVEAYVTKMVKASGGMLRLQQFIQDNNGVVIALTAKTQVTVEKALVSCLRKNLNAMVWQKFYLDCYFQLRSAGQVDERLFSEAVEHYGLAVINQIGELGQAVDGLWLDLVYHCREQKYLLDAPTLELWLMNYVSGKTQYELTPEKFKNILNSNLIKLSLHDAETVKKPLIAEYFQHRSNKYRTQFDDLMKFVKKISNHKKTLLIQDVPELEIGVANELRLFVPERPLAEFYDLTQKARNRRYGHPRHYLSIALDAFAKLLNMPSSAKALNILHAYPEYLASLKKLDQLLHAKYDEISESSLIEDAVVAIKKLKQLNRKDAAFKPIANDINEFQKQWCKKMVSFVKETIPDELRLKILSRGWSLIKSKNNYHQQNLFLNILYQHFHQVLMNSDERNLAPVVDSLQFYLTIIHLANKSKIRDKLLRLLSPSPDHEQRVNYFRSIHQQDVLQAHDYLDFRIKNILADVSGEGLGNGSDIDEQIFHPDFINLISFALPGVYPRRENDFGSSMRADLHLTLTSSRDVIPPRFKLLRIFTHAFAEALCGKPYRPAKLIDDFLSSVKENDEIQAPDLKLILIYGKSSNLRRLYGLIEKQLRALPGELRLGHPHYQQFKQSLPRVLQEVAELGINPFRRSNLMAPWPLTKALEVVYHLFPWYMRHNNYHAAMLITSFHGNSSQWLEAKEKLTQSNQLVEYNKLLTNYSALFSAGMSNSMKRNSVNAVLGDKERRTVALPDALRLANDERRVEFYEKLRKAIELCKFRVLPGYEAPIAVESAIDSEIGSEAYLSLLSEIPDALRKVQDEKSQAILTEIESLVTKSLKFVQLYGRTLEQLLIENAWDDVINQFKTNKITLFKHACSLIKLFGEQNCLDRMRFIAEIIRGNYFRGKRNTVHSILESIVQQSLRCVGYYVDVSGYTETRMTDAQYSHPIQAKIAIQIKNIFENIRLQLSHVFPQVRMVDRTITYTVQSKILDELDENINHYLTINNQDITRLLTWLESDILNDKLKLHRNTASSAEQKLIFQDLEKLAYIVSSFAYLHEKIASENIYPTHEQEPRYKLFYSDYYYGQMLACRRGGEERSLSELHQLHKTVQKLQKICEQQQVPLQYILEGARDLFLFEIVKLGQVEIQSTESIGAVANGRARLEALADLLAILPEVAVKEMLVPNLIVKIDAVMRFGTSYAQRVVIEVLLNNYLLRRLGETGLEKSLMMLQHGHQFCDQLQTVIDHMAVSGSYIKEVLPSQAHAFILSNAELNKLQSDLTELDLKPHPVETRLKEAMLALLANGVTDWQHHGEMDVTLNRDICSAHEAILLHNKHLQFHHQLELIPAIFADDSFNYKFLLNVKHNFQDLGKAFPGIIDNELTPALDAGQKMLVQSMLNQHARGEYRQFPLELRRFFKFLHGDLSWLWPQIQEALQHLNLPKQAWDFAGYINLFLHLGNAQEQERLFELLSTHLEAMNLHERAWLLLQIRSLLPIKNDALDRMIGKVKLVLNESRPKRVCFDYQTHVPMTATKGLVDAIGSFKQWLGDKLTALNKACEHAKPPTSAVILKPQQITARYILQYVQDNLPEHCQTRREIGLSVRILQEAVMMTAYAMAQAPSQVKPVTQFFTRVVGAMISAIYFDDLPELRQQFRDLHQKFIDCYPALAEMKLPEEQEVELYAASSCLLHQGQPADTEPLRARAYQVMISLHYMPVLEAEKRELYEDSILEGRVAYGANVSGFSSQQTSGATTPVAESGFFKSPTPQMAPVSAPISPMQLTLTSPWHTPSEPLKPLPRSNSAPRLNEILAHELKL